jgi:hypothetical protein
MRAQLGQGVVAVDGEVDVEPLRREVQLQQQPDRWVVVDAEDAPDVAEIGVRVGRRGCGLGEGHPIQIGRLTT